jgi:hypothetical protein
MTQMQHFYLSQISALPIKQPAETQVDTFDGLLESAVLTIPVLMAIGILAYRKCRAAALQQRILQLEKIWRLDCVRRSR